jgi:uroporphyrinogen-III synthase
MKNVTLLNTRPLLQGATLTALCQPKNIHCIRYPALDIVFLPLENIPTLPWDKIIFISANAVEGFIKTSLFEAKLKAKEIHSAPLYAIGQATANALRQQNLMPKKISQTQFDTEHFLQQHELQNLMGQTVALIKGQGGRDLLAATLKQRGAMVVEYDVYRRQATPFCAQAWAQFKAALKPVGLFTSVASMQAILGNLKQFLPIEDTQWFKQQTVIVFSERIQIALLQENWQGKIYITPTQNDEAICQILSRLDKSLQN